MVPLAVPGLELDYGHAGDFLALLLHGPILTCPLVVSVQIWMSIDEIIN